MMCSCAAGSDAGAGLDSGARQGNFLVGAIVPSTCIVVRVRDALSAVRVRKHCGHVCPHTHRNTDARFVTMPKRKAASSASSAASAKKSKSPAKNATSKSASAASLVTIEACKT